MGKKLERVEARIREHLAIKVVPTDRDDGLFHEGVAQGLKTALIYCTEAHYEAVPTVDHLAKAKECVMEDGNPMRNQAIAILELIAYLKEQR